MKKLTPAQVVVKEFGGIRPLAKAIDRDPSSIFRWVHSRKGVIPAKLVVKILSVSRERGIEITLRDIIFGR